MLKSIKHIIFFKWYHGIILGSRTLDLQAVSVMCIYAESNLGLVRSYIGDHYNLVLAGFIGANVILRFLTKNKIGAKKSVKV